MGRDLTAIVCNCMRVDEGEILDAIRAGARSIEAVGEACEAGTGCQTCHEAITLMLREAEAERRRAAPNELLTQLSLFGPDPK